MDRWIYDWNGEREGGDAAGGRSSRVELNDETLRDGLQNPSAKDPPLQAKREFLHILARLGIHAVNIGLPASGSRTREDALYLAKEIAKARLPLDPNCAARTLTSDVLAVADISQRAGFPITVATFIGSSAVRQFVEGWDLDFLVRATRESVSLAVREGLPVTFVTEDTTRARPEVLRRLTTEAIACGASGICIADTVGCATPMGARRLVTFLREVIAETGVKARLDWHGHMDRGLGLAACLEAAEAGADRLHGSALGLGERVGNTAMDLIMINLKLTGRWEGNLAPLGEYVEWVARWSGVPIPWNYPVFGKDAYRTGTGVHAAAILKALARGHHELADLVYSSIPPSWFGKQQAIEVGPMSGESNVMHWLRRHEVEPSAERVQAILHLAKEADHTLGDDEMWDALARTEKA